MAQDCEDWNREHEKYSKAVADASQVRICIWVGSRDRGFKGEG